MKHLYPRILKLIVLLLSLVLLASHYSTAQSCTPQGNQTSYGTGNVWIGYVYQGMSFNTYKGYVNEGSASSPNFDESFGGTQVSYNTNGCPAYTDTFSVRYRLSETFASGNYQFIVGGDDGYRLSFDGGATWAINKWADQGYASTTYTTALNGTYNMVLEYYEHFGSNRISYNMTSICTGTGDTTAYGTSNWIGNIYQGINFDMFKGQVTEGSAGNITFDENFGNPSGASVTYNTNSCSITTAQFTARYRVQQTLTRASYVITVGGDDGYRLSLDGGATWVINKWIGQSYTVSSYTAILSGTYNMVLEYYQLAGYDRLSFSMSSTTLPVTLVTWSVSALAADQAKLTWQTTDAIDFDHFIVQRSTDGVTFANVHTTPATTSGLSIQDYSYTDTYTTDGTIYYRLAMVDKDGTTLYSSINSLTSHIAQDIRIYPTVVENNSLFVESTQSVPNARLELFNMSGSKIDEKDWAVLDGRQQVAINAGRSGSLAAGAYIARLSDGQSILAKQIIIVK